MNLSKKNLAAITSAAVVKPSSRLFELPEKVLQFGTGVLLRGLPDYFIDKANRQGIFNGRVVVIKSTDAGDSSAFDKQDGLYTLCVRGIESGEKIEENIINSSISRVLSAKSQWKDILQCAHNPDMQVIISNTTEVGIRLVEEDIHQAPPTSFPGKLLAFLYERYKVCKGSQDGGMVIVPTELIVDNGKKLAAIVQQLAAFNKMEASFMEWLAGACRWCSSLVDRIVPGKPDVATIQQLQQELGYSDELLSISELYRLWAIEGDERVQSVLSFAAADTGVIIKPDIEIYRELKLRMLNGTHTLSCGLAYLAGFDTVKNAMDDPGFANFVSDLMLKEIAPSIPYTIPAEQSHAFGQQVLDRFRNPHLQHQWISITMQYSSKMKMRNVPILLQRYKMHSVPPPLFSLGFAAYLLFMKGGNYKVNDDKAEYFALLWKENGPNELVDKVLADTSLWDADLSVLPGFASEVKADLHALINNGALSTLAQFGKIKSVL
jgi:tagaturonate reductase